MLKNNLGYPRIGSQRELKRACENYWSGKISQKDLFSTARSIREESWKHQLEAGIDLIPCNDFSFYDHVLDTSLLLGNVPERYSPVLTREKDKTELDLYFAMARGYQKNGLDIKAMEMTKWFDSNYHYIVPEFVPDQQFRLFSEKAFADFSHARTFTGKVVKPVILGPVSYLLLGKEKQGRESGFRKISLIRNLLPVYVEVLRKFADLGASWIQIDEPFLSMDLQEEDRNAFREVYREFREKCPQLRILLTTYFGPLDDNRELALGLPVSALHLDLVRGSAEFDDLLAVWPETLLLSAGVVDGRNIWKNDYTRSLEYINKAAGALGKDRVMISTSCSLLHCPVDLSREYKLPLEVADWMSFARQKLQEINELALITEKPDSALLSINQGSQERRRHSALIHKKEVKERLQSIKAADDQRRSSFEVRSKIQKEAFNLPLFPTTTIGSFPQTDDIRQLRARLKKGELSHEEYERSLEREIQEVISWQEKVGLDVLVHGEFERNDMVEYFGELLDGFIFTQFGWVQSYGSRCVKPPVIFGDVRRRGDMTVRWSKYAQSLTDKIIKGMLTGPVTILQWSFVRDDQPRSETAFEIALAIRDEVLALEKAGIRMIQIDEPAVREGLPLRKADWGSYLDWAIRAFRLSASGVADSTQIHTHMCYSEFNDIIEHIAAMDADVITIESSRSQMDLLEAFVNYSYPNEIGPGFYDIHSPRVPPAEEIYQLIDRATGIFGADKLWVNPDCGLKTRKWPETKAALVNMVQAAERARLAKQVN